MHLLPEAGRLSVHGAQIVRPHRKAALKGNTHSVLGVHIGRRFSDTGRHTMKQYAYLSCSEALPFQAYIDAVDGLYIIVGPLRIVLDDENVLRKLASDATYVADTLKADREDNA